MRLSMNGDVPMMSPVTGSRSGAPGGSVSSRITTSVAPNQIPAERSPRLSASTLTSGASSACWMSLASTSGATEGS